MYVLTTPPHVFHDIRDFYEKVPFYRIKFFFFLYEKVLLITRMIDQLIS